MRNVSRFGCFTLLILSGLLVERCSVNLTVDSDCVNRDAFCNPAIAYALYASYRDVPVIVAAGGAGAVAVSYDEGLTWAVRATIATTNPIGGVTSNGAGTWVAVGGTGLTPEIFYSRDAGRTWAQAIVPAGIQQLNEVGYFSTTGVFVALGNTGTAVYSTNGVDWVSLSIAGASTVRSLEKVGDTYFAMGDGITFLKSTDGLAWNSTGSTPAVVPFDLAADPSGVLVTCGQFGAKSNFSTDNGATWTAPVLPPVAVYSGAAYVGGRFLCAGTGGATSTSTDGGNNWVTGTVLGTGINDLTVSDTGFVIAASTTGTFYRSADGINWTTHTAVTTASFGDVAKFTDRLLYRFDADPVDPLL